MLNSLWKHLDKKVILWHREAPLLYIYCIDAHLFFAHELDLSVFSNALCSSATVTRDVIE